MDVNIGSGQRLPIDRQLVDAGLSRIRERYHDRYGGRPEGFANGNRHQGRPTRFNFRAVRLSQPLGTGTILFDKRIIPAGKGGR